VTISLTDVEIFDGLLFCFNGGANDGAGHGFARSFDDADVEEMLQRYNKE
jgi:hypothetical protein